MVPPSSVACVNVEKEDTDCGSDYRTQPLPRNFHPKSTQMARAKICIPFADNRGQGTWHTEAAERDFVLLLHVVSSDKYMGALAGFYRRTATGYRPLIMCFCSSDKLGLNVCSDV